MRFFPVSLIEPNPTTHLSDTLEQIDVAKGLIEKYPDVRLVSVRLSNQHLQCFRHSVMRSVRRISNNPSLKERLPAYLASRGLFVSILLPHSLKSFTEDIN